MDIKIFVLKKFIVANSRMIKFIRSCDYYSDEVKLRKCSYFRNLNVVLFHDLKLALI